MTHTFAEMLKVFRKRADISQQELSDALKRSRNTISNWERGNTLPEEREVILAFKEVLSISSSELDELLNAAGYARQGNNQSLFEGYLTPIDKRRELIYRQPDGQTITIGDVKTSLVTWITQDEFTDCSVECQIKIIDDGGSDDKWAGIRVRGFHTDVHDIGLGYLVYLRSSGTVELYKQRKPLGGENNKVIQDPKNEWTSIRCDAVGPKIKVLVNNQRHISVSDSKFGAGYVCLHTYFVQAEFRNVRIFYIKP